MDEPKTNDTFNDPTWNWQRIKPQDKDEDLEYAPRRFVLIVGDKEYTYTTLDDNYLW